MIKRKRHTKGYLNVERTQALHTVGLPKGRFAVKDRKTLKRLKIKQTRRSWRDFDEKDWKKITRAEDRMID